MKSRALSDHTHSETITRSGNAQRRYASPQGHQPASDAHSREGQAPNAHQGGKSKDGGNKYTCHSRSPFQAAHPGLRCSPRGVLQRDRNEMGARA